MKDWLGLLALFVSLGGTFYAWLTSRSRINSTRIDEADKLIISHGARIQELESEVKHLPDKDTVIELKLSIAELKGTVGRLDESLASVARTVHRIDDYMREGGGK